MKKGIAFFLVCMLAIALTACTPNKQNEDSSTTSQNETDPYAFPSVTTTAECEQALETYLRFIEGDPSNYKGYEGAATSLLLLGERDKALDCLEKGISKTQNHQLEALLNKLLDAGQTIDVDSGDAPDIEMQDLSLIGNHISLDDSEDELVTDLLQPVYDLLTIDSSGNGVFDIVESQNYFDLAATLKRPFDSFYYGEKNAAGIRNGKGLALYGNGYYYYGNWVDGKREGSARWFYTLTQPNGAYYRGLGEVEFENNLPNGLALFHYSMIYGNWEEVEQLTAFSYTNGLADGYAYTQIVGEPLYERRYKNGALLPYHNPPQYTPEDKLVVGVSVNGQDSFATSDVSVDDLAAHHSPWGVCPGFSWLGSSEEDYGTPMIEQPAGTIYLTLDKVKTVFEALGHGVVTEETDETVAASAKAEETSEFYILFTVPFEYTSPTGVYYGMLYYPRGIETPDPSQDMRAFDMFWFSIDKTPEDLGILDGLQIYQGPEYEMGVYVDDKANTVLVEICSGYYTLDIYGTLDDLGEISEVVQMLSEV